MELTEPTDRVVRQSTVSDGANTETVKSVSNPAAERDHGKIVATRVVWFIAGVLLVVLGMRFILALLGANPSSGFVSFIYALSYPFVAPFFGAFSYDSSGYLNGQSKFELFTLLAMAVYALVAWGVSKLVNINRRTAA